MDKNLKKYIYIYFFLGMCFIYVRIKNYSLPSIIAHYFSDILKNALYAFVYSI